MANVQNLASGSLAENITTSSTTVLVYVGSGSAATIKAVWPSAPFYITVMPYSPTAGVANSLDSEVMKVTAVGNDQVGNVALTVTRAQKGTTAKAFNSGSIVTNGIYVEDLGISYSTDEVETAAKWVDGKTIYKKTLEIESFPNTTETSLGNLLPSSINIIKIEGTATAGTGVIPINGTRYGGDGTLSNGVATRADQTTGQVLISSNFNATSYYGYATYYYTKSS